MAARENQGYLIGIILLVLLTVILGVTTYLGVTKMNEYANQAAANEARLREERQAAQAWQTQAAILKSYLGIEGHSVAEVDTLMGSLRNTGQDTVIQETERIAQTYRSDIRGFINRPEGVNATWRGLVNDFGKTLARLHNDISVLNNRIQQIEREKETELAAKQKTVEELQGQLATTRGDLETERQRHTDTRNTLQAALNRAQAELQRANQLVAQTQQTLGGQIQELRAAAEQQTTTIARLQERLRSYETERFEVADGRVVSVSPTTGTIFINLGHNDHLRAGQTFAVYDQNTNQFERGNEKATVEVTRVMGPHLAEARVTSSEDRNPILNRDFVLTATWEPGHAVSVAIVGKIDMNNDGRSDLERLISIIRRNGGEVVAYQDDEGNIVGEINEQTRYIVKGATPDGREAATTMREFLELSKQYYVQELSVREMLNAMGFRNEAGIQRMDGQEGQPRFQQRQPPARTTPNGTF